MYTLYQLFQQMSGIPTAHATDEDLHELGLRKRSDLICLQRFCVEKVQESEKERGSGEAK